MFFLQHFDSMGYVASRVFYNNKTFNLLHYTITLQYKTTKKSHSITPLHTIHHTVEVVWIFLSKASFI